MLRIVTDGWECCRDQKDRSKYILNFRKVSAYNVMNIRARVAI
jgi:hypothetical protein